jgi:hypothetical protein
MRRCFRSVGPEGSSPEAETLVEDSNYVDYGSHTEYMSDPHGMLIKGDPAM